RGKDRSAVAGRLARDCAWCWIHLDGKSLGEQGGLRSQARGLQQGGDGEPGQGQEPRPAQNRVRGCQQGLRQLPRHVPRERASLALIRAKTPLYIVGAYRNRPSPARRAVADATLAAEDSMTRAVLAIAALSAGAFAATAVLADPEAIKARQDLMKRSGEQMV